MPSKKQAVRNAQVSSQATILVQEVESAGQARRNVAFEGF
jgi:hypothetical protein